MSSDAPVNECESEIDHYTRHYVPYSLRLCVGSLTFHRFFYMCKGLWDGAYGLPSLSVLTNYACDFSQSETERYFEWIIIHHNQLLLAKFGKNFVILNRWRQNGVKSAVWFQVTEPLTEKTWRRGWVVLIVRTKCRNCRGTFYSFHGDILSKNFARTARRQLDGQHLLFGAYLLTWADLNPLKFPIKMHYRF